MADIEHIAIERLKTASEMSLTHYGQPLVVTTSGGKDSSVCVELAIRAGIPFEVMHNHTTADAPETVYFVRREFQRLEEKGLQCTLNLPTYKGERTSMWKLIPQRLMPPTRLARYCCNVLKENGGAGRFIATGVRWAESISRKNSRGIYEKNGTKKSRIILNNDNDDRRMLFENCRIKAKRTVNPIIDWSDKDVWDFLNDAKVPINPLYEEGWCRVGCVGCPQAGKAREKQFARWPRYRQLYLNAFDKLIKELQQRNSKGLWSMNTTALDIYNWWMEYDIIPGQLEMSDLLPQEVWEDDDYG